MTSRELFHFVRLKASHARSHKTTTRAGGRSAEEDAAVAEIVAFAPPGMFHTELRSWARQFFVDQRAANERGQGQ